MKTIEELKEHFKEYEFSQKYIDILRYIRENNDCKISIQGNAGSGKALPLDTIIPTPNGYMRFGDLKVGDYVFDRHGKSTKVVGVFPQGKLKSYKVIFSDGRETYCNDEHLWTYYTSRGNLKTSTLKEMMKNGIKGTNNKIKFQIPMNECVEFKKTKKLDVDPYIMGCFIANGCNLEKRLTFSSDDLFTINTCADILKSTPRGCSKYNYSYNFIKNGNKLNTLDILGKYKNEVCVKSIYKCIPNDYKYSSVENRWSLIQGLFDTDGSITCNNRANIRYSTSSKKLADDVREVLWSLGIISTLYIDSRKNNANYVIYVCIDNDKKNNFFRLPRKLARIPSTKKRKNYDRIGIVDVIPINKKVDMMCIKVDNNEELFLTNDYIVTHNTTLLKIIHYMFSDDIKNEILNVAVASSTGVASALLNENVNIGATTIHSLFKLQPINIYGELTGSKVTNREVISNIDVLIIDEISMVSCDLFDYIMRYLKLCRQRKPTRVILFGDCLQLQCVVKDDDPVIKKYYDETYNGNHEFFSSNYFKDMNFVTFLLKKIYRQNEDDKFVQILNKIRVGEQTKEDLKYINQRVVDENTYIMNNESFLRIVSTNKDVEKYNRIALDMIDGDYICLKADITGTFRESSEFKSGLFAEKVYVKIGCSVMITRNAQQNEDGTRDYYNGNIGILKNFANDVAFVDLGNKTVAVPRSTTNNYEYVVDENNRVESRIVGSYTNVMIKPCSASTIFKCQGLTINNGYLDFGWWIPQNSIYVALSRFRKIDDFALRKPIRMKDIIVNEESLDYLIATENEDNRDIFSDDDCAINMVQNNKVEALKKFLIDNKIEFKNGSFYDKETNKTLSMEN